MPAREIFLIGLNRDFRDAAEVDRDHRRDIRDCESVAGDIAAIPQFVIEPLKIVFGVAHDPGEVNQ